LSFCGSAGAVLTENRPDSLLSLVTFYTLNNAGLF